MGTSTGGFHGGLATWRGRLPTPDGKPFVVAFGHWTLSVEMYAPRGVDTQTPHRRDEVYLVVRGEGDFVNGPDRHRFGPGDRRRITRTANQVVRETRSAREWAGFPEGAVALAGNGGGDFLILRAGSDEGEFWDNETGESEPVDVR
jgi:hypothetical protein